MGLLDCLSPRVILTSALVLGSLVNDVLARPPSSNPNSAWKHGPGPKKMAHDIKRAVQGHKRAEPSSPCTVGSTAVQAPKANPWKSLSNEETAAIVEWLFAQKDLNLTTTEEATNWDNTIILVEAMFPNKTDAVSYLDRNGTAPTQYAHVMLNMRATEDPHYADILVGPLPINNQTTKWEPLTFPYTKKNGGRVRNIEADIDIQYYEWIPALGASIVDITLDLWNGTALGLDNDTIAVWGFDPLWQDDGRVLRWDAFWNLPTNGFDAITLLPLGLYVLSDVTGRDPSKWKVEGWLYNDIFYETTEEFRKAYWSAGFKKLPPNVSGDWSGTDQQGTVPPKDTASPPIQVAPGGSRYSVDIEQQYVEWMDFSFYIGFTRDTGAALYDIRYKGERIIYELSLQEALAHYAGIDPVQSGTSYLDAFYGFGPFSFQLVRGYDCPSHATYLNSTFYSAETCRTHIESICLFEFDGEHPIQRHTTANYVSVTKDNHFVVRWVSTVGNYDYMFSYTFHLDGTIGVEVRASGYIQSAYYANNQDYGFQIQDHLSGSMHDHVLNFKADFDILGTKNSLQLVSMVPTTTTYSWSRGKPRNTMKLKREFVETEDQGRFNWAGPMQVIVVNENAANPYGEPRGYRIKPYTGTGHLTVQNSTNLGKAARWAEHDIHVTKRKDTEPRSAHAWNNQDIYDPPIDFSRFFDGESLRNEDLVLWLNLGMHHIPHSGDIPNTVMTTAHSSLQFTPHNYFGSDQSRRTVNQVRIDYADGSATSVRAFGSSNTASGNGTCALSHEPVRANLWTYSGDIVVRKFPFDPNNPYYETEGIV